MHPAAALEHTKNAAVVEFSQFILITFNINTLSIAIIGRTRRVETHCCGVCV
jgi:hypothetical protein